jgi:hypothetical protein
MKYPEFLASSFLGPEIFRKGTNVGGKEYRKMENRGREKEMKECR